MATYTRTFWTVPGQVDKDGHPVEFPTLEAAKAKASAGGIAGTGIGAGVGPVPAGTAPVEVREEMTEDGEYVQTANGQEIGRGVDKSRLDLYKARQDAAKGSQPDTTPKTITAADGRVLQYDPTTNSWKEVAGPKPEKPAETVTETTPGGGRRQVTTAQADQDYREAQELARQKQLNQQELTQAAQAKHQQLQTMVALGQLEQKDADARMDRWKAGVEAGQAERRLSIEQQNANTSAGQLGVSRGTLGVNQQNADTNREQVIQSAASNAVDQTLKLLSQYTKVGPGFGAQFSAGLNTLSRGGGPMTVTPDAFMVTPPDLNAIRSQAVTEAIDRLKTGNGMAPATAAAVNATSVPGAVAPGAVPPPPAQPPQVFTPAAIGAAGQAAGILPGAPPAPPPVLPPYTGPVGQGGPGAPSAY